MSEEEIKDKRPVIEQMEEAMQEFVDRMDKGKVKSIYTYNKFKRILKQVNKHKTND